ncbi:MAG TPA: metal-dependent hydrolase [Polyangiaceae bacterium]|nr:metal-dependent hydrolase [Polyangiaceae bacterium]
MPARNTILDNITHSIAGLLAAQAAIELRRAWGKAQGDAANEIRFARTAYWVSALANNLPDIDFVYSQITRPRTLGYLMHHRGHTHTLCVAAVMVASLLLAFRGAARRYGPKLLQLDWRWLWGLGLLGPMLHMAMDFTNNYGVHPFWPLYNGWLYGDSVFIIEPLYLLTGLPLLFFAMRHRLARIVFALLTVALLALVWWVSFIPTSVSVGLSLFTILASFAAARLPAGRRVAIGASVFAAIPVVFSLARTQAEPVVRAALPPGAKVVDIVLTPSPSNPLCWSTWAAYVSGDDYVADSGRLTLAPTLFAPSDCEGPFHAGPTTADLQPLDTAPSTQIRFSRRYQAPLSELRSLQASNCYAAAYLRYSRLPFWKTEGDRTILGDLRYDRSEAIDFAELVLPKTHDCPQFVPNWVPPREDLWR